MSLQIQDVLSGYSVDEVGSYQSSTSVVVGLIHATYRVETTAGSFCLQRLHPKLASDGILSDYRVVTNYLAKKGFPGPKLLSDKSGNPAVEDAEGHRWRLTTWLEGENTSVIRSPKMCFSGAALLGCFHQTMSDLNYEFQSTHPLHDTEYHLQYLRDGVDEYRDDPWYEKIAPMVAEVEKELPPLLLPELPTLVVHGDPKISNFLFDGDDNATALLDLDTCTRHSPLVDLGDAIRAWCQEDGVGGEPSFAMDCFQSIMEGYRSTGPTLDAKTIGLLPQAGLHITLELTARFLADVLYDNYFAWDTEAFASRREHNFARSQKMLAFSKSIRENLPQLTAIVEKTFAS